MSSNDNYAPGDIVNGWRLGSDGEWHMIEEPPVAWLTEVPPKRSHHTRNVLIIIGVLMLLLFVGCAAVVANTDNPYEEAPTDTRSDLIVPDPAPPADAAPVAPVPVVPDRTFQQETYLEAVRMQAVLDPYSDDQLLDMGRWVLDQQAAGVDFGELVGGAFLVQYPDVPEFGAGFIIGAASGVGRL